MSHADRVAAAVLGAATFAVFAAGAGRLGFYWDDAPALATLPQADLPGLARHIWNYVPGRNLHVLWQYLFLKLSSNLTVLHVAQSVLDGLVVAVFYVLLRRADLPAPPSALAAGLFAFWPTHGETHFWLYAAPQNLVSTLLVLLFALWNHPVFFVAALFTYDQTVFVVAAIAAWRGVRSRRLVYLYYLIPIGLFAWLKIFHAPGRGPELRSEALPMLLANVPATVSATFGRAFVQHVTPLLAKATLTDWALAAAAAAAVAVLAARLPGSARPAGRGVPAVALVVAAYLPIWLWHMSQRHHYLPSAALFAGVAAVAARAPAGALAGMAAVLLTPLAAAGRGESRYWEESFAYKKQLFADLRPHLKDKKVLALEGFPLRHGPAYFITPPDPHHAPGLLFPDLSVRAGDISSSPAPRGIFLQTSRHHHGPEAFRYHPTDRYLYVRHATPFHQVVDAPPAPYEVLPPDHPPRREGPHRVVQVRFDGTIRPGRHLAAVVHYRQADGGFHPWGGPLLLDRPGTHSLLLRDFPETDRARIDFYEAGPDGSPLRLGRLELPFEP